MKYQFYDVLRDKVTGFQGVVTTISEQIVGCIRYGIQPRLKADGNYPDAFHIDETQLELVTEGAEGDRRPGKTTYPFALGSKVQDIDTSEIGTVISVTEHLNGCISYLSQPEKEKGSKDNRFVTYSQRLVLVQEPPASTQTVEEKRKTGGPIERSSPEKVKF